MAKATGSPYHLVVAGPSGATIYDVDGWGHELFDVTPRANGAGGGISYGDQYYDVKPYDVSFGSISSHYDEGWYKSDNYRFGSTTLTEWSGHNLSSDTLKSWSPWSVSTEVDFQQSDYWGREIQGPGFDSLQFVSQNHSELIQHSESFGTFGPSVFDMLVAKDDTLQFSQNSFDGIYREQSLVSDHSEHQVMSWANPQQIGYLAQMMASHHSDSFVQAPGIVESHSFDSAVHESFMVIATPSAAMSDHGLIPHM